MVNKLINKTLLALPLLLCFENYKNKKLDFKLAKKIKDFIKFPALQELYHSMAMGNLNKSKETTPTTTTALKVAP